MFIKNYVIKQYYVKKQKLEFNKFSQYVNKIIYVIYILDYDINKSIGLLILFDNDYVKNAELESNIHHR